MIYSEIKVTSVEEIQARLGKFKSQTPLVLSRAINRAIQNVGKNMAKETSARYYISSSDVKDSIETVKASKGRLKAIAISGGDGIALSKFKVSPKKQVKRTKKGKYSPRVYKAAVKKSGGLKPLDGDPKSFIGVMKNSSKKEGASDHTGVWTRKSEKRLPLKQLYGPSIPQMIKNEEIMSKINKEASETLQKRIDAEINNILRKG